MARGRTTILTSAASGGGGQSGQVAYFNSFGEVTSDSSLTYTANGGPLSTTGVVRTGNGTLTVPAYSYVGETGLGFFRSASNQITAASNGVDVGTFNSSTGYGFQVSAARSIGWSSGNSGTASTDLTLFRDAANTLAQRNGANAQTFNIYNTFTDASNYERFAVSWATNTATLTTTANGTGTSRSLIIGTDNGKWTFSGSGASLVPNTDNAFAFGSHTLRIATANIVALNDVSTINATNGAGVSCPTIAMTTDSGNQGAGTIAITGSTNTTTTNAYTVKGGQGATTPNTGWVKVYVGTSAAWVPYWQNATP